MRISSINQLLRFWQIRQFCKFFHFYFITRRKMMRNENSSSFFAIFSQSNQSSIHYNDSNWYPISNIYQIELIIIDINYIQQISDVQKFNIICNYNTAFKLNIQRPAIINWIFIGKINKNIHEIFIAEFASQRESLRR